MISAAKELKRLKGGVRQGRVIGNIDEIFQSISQGGQRIGKNSFRLPDGTIITKYSSSTTGVPTIHINKQGQLFKIRVETGINIEFNHVFMQLISTAFKKHFFISLT